MISLNNYNQTFSQFDNFNLNIDFDVRYGKHLQDKYSKFISITNKKELTITHNDNEKSEYLASRN